MLKLQHIHKSFSSKVIFDDTKFIANPNELTILIGPSGAGKTTLFNIILNIENCDYTFNNDNISDLDKKEKEQFILDNISYASQKPTFIADLKMNDQIVLLKQIYNNDYDVSELITLFELDKLLDCYPNQLSGGEKNRFAFILALLKPARIYMFDEPTSALDDLQASHIVTVLNKLKKQGNIVIISTHDHRLIEQGDKVYSIENKKLNVKKQKEKNETNQKTKETNNFILNNLGKYWYKMTQHHKMYNKIMHYLLATGIVVALAGIEYGFLVEQRLTNVINNKDVDNVLYVMKEPYVGAAKAGFQSEIGVALDEKDYNKIKELEHVKDYYYHLNYSIAGQRAENGSVTEDKRTVNVHLNDKSTCLTLDEFETAGTFTTYPNEIDYSDKIKEE